MGTGYRNAGTHSGGLGAGTQGQGACRKNRRLGGHNKPILLFWPTAVGVYLGPPGVGEENTLISEVFRGLFGFPLFFAEFVYYSVLLLYYVMSVRLLVCGFSPLRRVKLLACACACPVHPAGAPGDGPRAGGPIWPKIEHFWAPPRVFRTKP